VLEAALEQVEGRARVGTHGVGWIATGARGIGHSGEVEDGVAAGDERTGGGLARVELDQLEGRPGGPLGAARARQRHHLVPALCEEGRGS
jgi:hypothetical protein